MSKSLCSTYVLQIGQRALPARLAHSDREGRPALPRHGLSGLIAEDKRGVDLMRVIVFIAAFILASCAQPPREVATGGAIVTWTGTATEADPQACVARGGTMQRICLQGKLACVETYKDAGKPCTDKSQCFGQCRYAGRAAPGVSVVGECQRTSDPCGCFATVAGGKHQGMLCID
jgi:hypothetical protein